MFDLDRFTSKIWDSQTVYYETIAFVEQMDGTIAPGTLLYVPERILAVRSNNMQSSYQENEDYTLSENRLTLTKHSKIRPYPRSEYCEPIQDSNRWMRIMGTDQALRVNPQLSRVYQVQVCYTHTDTWKGLQPESQIGRLPKTEAKLRKKQPMKIVFYGDSITVGYDTSGLDESAIDQESLQPVRAVGGMGTVHAVVAGNGYSKA